MHTLRRNIRRGLAIALLAIGATTVAMPATASAATTLAAERIVACPAIYPRPAYCDGIVAETPTASLGHVGWTYLNLNYCPPGRMCTAIYRDSMTAWSWNGRAWSQTSLRQGWVYVYPYTGSWRWAWTQSTGWVAVSGGRFELRRY